MAYTNNLYGNKEYYFNDKTIFISGGTGTLGKEITKLLCEKYNPKEIKIFSRDELKQKEMEVLYKKYNTKISYLLGDIRDFERLKLAMARCDYVIHTAALKDIIKCENDPVEAIKTNVEGSKNIALASIYNGIQKCVLISTDKAVYPVNLYGSTKMTAERLFIDSNKYHDTLFSVCRYGNVIGSRGSVIQLFQKQKLEGTLKITDFGMTRFWITVEEVAQFVLDSLIETKGKEIFIPKMKSCYIKNVADIIAPECTQVEIGIRESEKLHECLITEEESHHAKILENKYIIDYDYNNPIPFSYTSKDCIMNMDELKEKIKEFI